MPVTILYEDNHLLVGSKPPGWLTQPSGRNEESLESWAKAQIKGKFLEAIHRLDRAASGIVVFAKTRKALSRLMKAIRESHVEKTYLAWAEGDLPEPEGTLEDLLVHSHHKARVVKEGGKLARLSYKKINPSLYRIGLETGRYHQIRIQFASRGCPIVGDTKYGAAPISELGICLHHAECRLSHPITGESLTFKADPPYNRGHA